MHLFWQIGQYLQYFFLKEDRHSVHSPFVFNWYVKLFSFLKENKKGDHAIEAKRALFRQSSKKIKVFDLGAGSKFSQGPFRTLSSLVKYSCSPLKFSLLYQYLCQLTPAVNVLELGTSLGLNTAYLYQVTKGKLYTLEACPNLSRMAMENFGTGSDIEFVKGDIADKLPAILEEINQIDFVLMDANHRYGPTKFYFEMMRPFLHEESIVVVSDIHWSPEMKAIWMELKGLPEISLSVDLFECGILFLKNLGPKAHYILKY
ncbi:MAG: class I SAM-dependent methyltransferase [Cyclobacteriaceae bacterium]